MRRLVTKIDVKVFSFILPNGKKISGSEIKKEICNYDDGSVDEWVYVFRDGEEIERHNVRYLASIYFEDVILYR